MKLLAGLFWGFLSLVIVLSLEPLLFWLRTEPPRAEPLDPEIDSNEIGEDVDVRR